MTKYPKVVWVGFTRDNKAMRIGLSKNELWVCPSTKSYHLHPGNEVVRALNTVDGYFVMSKRNGGKFIAKDLRKAGFRVRWDAKKGRLV